ncbi:MAG: hypothetical protein QOD27_301, partial [Microbacteriaceae bacterium]|nr:hypothetical protein [Microbacteriaceae bacterium]
MTAILESYSQLAIYSAMAVYTLAFIAFTLDLAKRTAAVQVVAAAPAVRVGVLTRAGGTATLEREPEVAAPVVPPTPRSSPFERVALSLTVVAWLLHVAGTVLRGVAAHRVPWANMFEFSLTASAIIVTVF